MYVRRPHCSSHSSPTLTLSRVCESQESSLAYHQSEHLRLNGIYWGLTALYIMGRQDALDREEMIRMVMACWDEKAGESGAESEGEGGGRRG